MPLIIRCPRHAIITLDKSRMKDLQRCLTHHQRNINRWTQNLLLWTDAHARDSQSRVAIRLGVPENAVLT